MPVLALPTGRSFAVAVAFALVLVLVLVLVLSLVLRALLRQIEKRYKAKDAKRMRRAAASDKISLKQGTGFLWGCVCVVAIATHVREVRCLQRGRKTICHDIPSAPGLSSLTQRHRRVSVPTPVPTLVPVSAAAALHLRFTFRIRAGEEKRKIFEMRKKKERELFHSSPPWEFFLP